MSEFNYRVQKSPTLDPKLSQFVIIHTYFLKDCFHYYFFKYSEVFFLQAYRLNFCKHFSSPHTFCNLPKSILPYIIT